MTPTPPPAALDAASTAYALLRALGLRDPATARHSVAVARYAHALAQRLSLSPEDSELAYIAGLLHDVGKLSFPDRVLRGDEVLLDEDWALIRRHPELGAELVAGTDVLVDAAEVVEAHHERPDGHGYPRGLCGHQIPLLARVLSVVDCFDAMTARDSYRVPLSPPTAVVELERVAGPQLDPELVDAFVMMLSSDPPNDDRTRRFGVRGRTAEEVGAADAGAPYRGAQIVITREMRAV